METLFKDLRYGIRSLLKQPAFTLVAVITLALGIGANSAMFTVVNAVLLRPLSYPESDRIMLFEGVNPPQGITQSNMSIPDFVDWQKQNQVFEQLAGFYSGGLLLTSGDETERVRGAGVTEDFFPLFRTGAIKGRTLQADDAQKGRDPVVLLSYAIWQRRFGGDQNVVGSKVSLGGKGVTIVGVMPPGFDYPAQTELWVPYPIDAAAERRDNRFFQVVARLKPGVTLPQAQAQMDTINQRLAQSYAETNTGWSARVIGLQESLVGSMRKSLLVLLGAIALVLLIACANVANLLLARATARQKEIALRTALGASRWRVIRQLLTESVLLSLVGGAVGLMLSVWLTKLLISISPTNTPRLDEIRPDARVFAFTLGLTVLTGFIFGLAPALQVNDVLGTSIATQRMSMLLLSAFAAMALLLAMIGIYGVTAYYVTQRTQEIGIRMALGAQMSDVMKLVFRNGMALALIGVVVGLAGAFALTRLMASLLFAVKPTDVMTFAIVSVCLLLTALIACYLPARRATKVDPLVALRYE
jgi:predicted permease